MPQALAKRRSVIDPDATIAEGKPLGKDLLYRLGGALALAVGIGFGWFEIIRPLQAAYAHAPEVKYDSRIFVMVPACLVFGLFFIIGGARWEYRDAERKSLTRIGWALMAIVAIAAAGSFYWFDQQFSALGYHVG